MSTTLVKRHSGVDFTLFKTNDAADWGFEYEIFGHVRRGQLPGNLLQDDAAAQVATFIDDELLSRGEKPK